MPFKEITIESQEINSFNLIGKDWFLVSAGDTDKFNTMTASWGSMGVMWGKNMFLTVIRPSRYTLEFVDKKDYFSICFFEEKYKDKLSYCGKNSGRDVDKIKETNLTPIFLDNVPAFDEAKMIFICKKAYKQQLSEDCFIDKSNLKWYNNDLHFAIAGEIVKAYKKD